MVYVQIRWKYKYSNTVWYVVVISRGRVLEEMQTIVALGAGAITKAVYPNGRIERCENVKDIKTYLEKTDEMIERKKRLFADWKWSQQYIDEDGFTSFLHQIVAL